MQYTILEGRLRFEWHWIGARSKKASSEFDYVPGMSTEKLTLIGGVLTSMSNGMALKSIKQLIAALRAIFWFVRRELNRWPIDQEWPLIIYNFYSYQLLEGADNRSIESSRAAWADIRSLLLALMSKNIIPKLNLPVATLPRRSKRKLGDGLVLGEAMVQCVPARLSEPILPKIFLCDVTYTKNDANFFEHIQIQLASSSDVVFNVCQSYWQEMLRCHVAGRKLITSISPQELAKVLNDPQWQKPVKKAFHHIANPRTTKGLAYFLAAVDYHFFETGLISNISLKEICKIPFLKPVATLKQIGRGIGDRLRAELGVDAESGDNLICRALGVLTTRDCAAATAILMHEQPRFTPESLEAADAYDKHGKALLTCVDDLSKSMSFTIIKNRAKSRKGGKMTSVALDVLFDILKATERVRDKASREQPDVARKLFLVVTRNGFGYPGRLGKGFNGSASVYDTMLPWLSVAGFTRSSFTLSKVRSTQGILVWLETESISAMASALGNSTSVVLRQYIPDWLYRRMLIRVARRLQQKLVLIATANTSHLMAVSDFDKTGDLNKFVYEVLSVDDYTSPLSDALRKAFPQLDQPSSPRLSGHLYLSLSPESFAALEVFVKYRTAEVCSGFYGGHIAAVELRDLYDLLYAAMHDHPVDEADSIVLKMVSGGSGAFLRWVWKISRDLVAQYASKIQSSSELDPDGDFQ